MWIDISQKKIHEWSINIWKDGQHQYSSGKGKLKLQCDIMLHLLKCLKLKRLPIPNVGEDV